jgi:hypothetical protein
MNKTTISLSLSWSENKLQYIDSLAWAEKSFNVDDFKKSQKISGKFIDKIKKLYQEKREIYNEINNIVTRWESDFWAYREDKIDHWLNYEMANPKRELINKEMDSKDVNEVSPLTYTHCSRLWQNIFLQYELWFSMDVSKDEEWKKQEEAVKKVIDVCRRTSWLKTKIKNFGKDQIVMWEVYARFSMEVKWEEFKSMMDIIPMMCITYKKWYTPEETPYLVYSWYEDIDKIISRWGPDIKAHNDLKDEDVKEFVKSCANFWSQRWVDRKKYKDNVYLDRHPLIQNQKSDSKFTMFDTRLIYTPDPKSPYSIYLQELYMKDTIIVAINWIVLFSIKNYYVEYFNGNVWHPYYRWVFNGNEFDTTCSSLPQVLRVPQKVSDIAHNAIVDVINRSLDPMRKTDSETEIDWYEDWVLRYEAGKIIRVDWKFEQLDIELGNDAKLFQLVDINNQHAWVISGITKYSWWVWNTGIERSARAADLVSNTTEWVARPVVESTEWMITKSSKINIINYLKKVWSKIKIWDEDIEIKKNTLSENWTYNFISDWITEIEKDKSLQRLLDVVWIVKDLIIWRDYKNLPMMKVRSLLQEIFNLAGIKWIMISEEEAQEIVGAIQNNGLDNDFENNNNNDIVNWAETFEDAPEENMVDLSFQ